MINDVRRGLIQELMTLIPKATNADLQRANGFLRFAHDCRTKKRWTRRAKRGVLNYYGPRRDIDATSR